MKHLVLPPELAGLAHGKIEVVNLFTIFSLNRISFPNALADELNNNLLLKNITIVFGVKA